MNVSLKIRERSDEFVLASRILIRNDDQPLLVKKEYRGSVRSNKDNFIHARYSKQTE